MLAEQPSIEIDTPQLRHAIDIDSPKFHLFDEVMKVKYPYEIEGEENIEEVHRLQQEYQKTHGKFMPMLDVWNHEGTADPAIAGHFTAVYLSDVASGVLIPVSHHYAATNAYPLYRFGVNRGRTAGYIMPPIDQSYRGRDEYRSSKEEREFQTASTNRSKEFIRTIGEELPKGVLISIAPEGHRSRTLNPPESGAGVIVQKMAKLIANGEIENGLIIPRGIYENPETGRLVVKVGKPLYVEDVISQAKKIAERYGIKETASLNAHALMLILRDLIPEDMAGVYSENQTEEFKKKLFSDQIKLISENTPFERSFLTPKVVKRTILRDFTEPYEGIGINLGPIVIYDFNRLNPLNKLKHLRNLNPLNKKEKSK